MTRVAVQPALFEWARHRARLDAREMARLPRLADWQAGTVRPTLHQLQQLAHATHTPVGHMLLPTPPKEVLPIPASALLAT